ncbi:MAG: fused MFS/spermidine synthase [Chloroflexi bacterium]|nr:fused MFS/spermidine synthase [Chloroflexota bacterium]
MTTVAAAPAVRTRPADRTSRLVWWLVLLFFLSGASGLVYQVLWVRMLSLSFGITVYAVTVVLASFMGGLALGSFFGGRLAERIQRPLLVYAIIEIGVALVAILTPSALTWLQSAYPAVARSVGDSEAILTVVRVIMAFAVLAAPTTLMGATLPIIVKSSLARYGDLPGRIGLLYSANTFGAIFGTMLAGFWLIGGIGISASIILAASVNALVGLIAFLLQRFVIREGETRVEESDDAVAATSSDTTPAYSARIRTATLVAYGLSGLISFALEVSWTRMLSLMLDTSIYAFVTMLSMVLIGIALGSAVVTPLMRRKVNVPLLFAALELGIAIGGIWAIWAVSNLAEIRGFLEATRGLRRLAATSTNFNFVVAAVTILPTTFMIGATFPLAARIYTVGLDRSSERLGQIYAVNVFGAIFGSMLGGFVLLPLLGTQASLLLLSVASLGLAGLLLLASDWRTLPSRAVLTAAGTAAFIVLWIAKPDLYHALFSIRFKDSQVEWFREGIETTVSIVRNPEGVRTLYTNSRGQANDEPGLVQYHRKIAHTPLLVRARAQDVLIVGLGAGHTAGSILQHEGTRVQVVELSDAIVEGAERFSAVNYDVMHNPNLSIRMGDGRNFLLTSTQKYDIITTDTIQPLDAGSTNLYSAEYYRLALASLKPDGVMAQWIGPHDDYQYKTMLRTYLAVFPHVTLWLTADLVIGSREPIQLDMAETAKRFESPRAREALRQAGFGGVEEVPEAFVATRDEIAEFVGPGPILSDDRPFIEYYRSLPGRGQGAPPDIWNSFSRDPRKVIKR